MRERRQFDQAIADFQGVQWMIADRETDLEASRLLILNAAAKKDRGEPFAKEASMAKLFASEAAHRCTDTAAAAARRRGLLPGLPGRAPGARRAHHPDLRGNVGNPAADHRTGDAAECELNLGCDVI